MKFVKSVIAIALLSLSSTSMATLYIVPEQSELQFSSTKVKNIV